MLYPVVFVSAVQQSKSAICMQISSLLGFPSQFRAPLVAQTVKNLPATQETWVLSLGQEDLLEKGMTTHSSILTRRIPWTEKPGGLQSTGSQSRTRLSGITPFFTFPLRSSQSTE